MAKAAKKDPRSEALKNFEGYMFGSEGATEFIPTGHSHLDQIIAAGELDIITKDKAKQLAEVSQGGLPMGRIVMIYGDPSGGKSSIAYRVCGYAQRLYPDRIPIWFDLENSFSEQLCTINGCDYHFLGRKKNYDDTAKELMCMEKIMDLIGSAIESGASVVVMDSAKGAIPKYQLENPAEKDTMALRARIFSKCLPKIASLAAAHNCLVIIINQMMHDPGNMWNPEGTGGGNTLKHLCSVVLKIKKTSSEKRRVVIEDDDGNDIVVAQMSNVYIEKNRFGAPYYGSVEVPIYFRYYFPNFEEVLFNAGRQTKVISVRLNVYSWGGLKAEGRNAFVELLKANHVLLPKLVEEIKEAAVKDKIALPPEVLNAEKHLANKEFTETELKKHSKKNPKTNVETEATTDDETEHDIDEPETSETNDVGEVGTEAETEAEIGNNPEL